MDPERAAAMHRRCQSKPPQRGRNDRAGGRGSPAPGPGHPTGGLPPARPSETSPVGVSRDDSRTAYAASMPMVRISRAPITTSPAISTHGLRLLGGELGRRGDHSPAAAGEVEDRAAGDHQVDARGRAAPAAEAKASAGPVVSRPPSASTANPSPPQAPAPGAAALVGRGQAGEALPARRRCAAGRPASSPAARPASEVMPRRPSSGCAQLVDRARHRSARSRRAEPADRTDRPGQPGQRLDAPVQRSVGGRHPSAASSPAPASCTASPPRSTTSCSGRRSRRTRPGPRRAATTTRSAAARTDIGARDLDHGYPARRAVADQRRRRPLACSTRLRAGRRTRR